MQYIKVNLPLKAHLEQIQARAYEFLDDESEVFRQLKWAKHVDKIEQSHSLLVYHDSITYLTYSSKKSRAHDNFDYLCAQIPVPPLTTQEGFDKLRYEVDHLFAGLINCYGCRTIIEQPEISVYSFYFGDDSCFIVWQGDPHDSYIPPCKLMEGVEVEQILLDEIKLNRGYSMAANNGLVKYFGHKDLFSPCSTLFTITSKELDYILYQNADGDYFSINYTRMGDRYLFREISR